jgi:polysaccharide pyruvyl transferase WcaK-like protein/predicted GH43/DUF377 family glycosyl hydrolase
MEIHDLTEKIKTCYMNNYVFNNSIVHWKDNLFIMVYRNIVYNLCNPIHPWGFWFKASKMMPENKMKRTSNSYQFNTLCPRKCIHCIRKNYNVNKYRTCLYGETYIPLSQFRNDVNMNLIEFDSTGLCILDDKFNVLYNINNIFGDSSNQDARIYNFDGVLYLTYNTFINKDNKVNVAMIKRRINIDNKCIYLHKEEYLLTMPHRSVEKNCILLPNMNVLYGIQDKFVLQINDTRIIYESHILKKLCKSFGTKLEMSLSTPVIKFGLNYLSLGHAKIDYLNNTHPLLLKFYEKYNVNMYSEQIKRHGRYIYFMFLYIFDTNYNIIAISDLFIPTINNNHLPYLLVFPTGLTCHNNKYTISYGEGDERCKLLILSESEIMSCMKYNNHKCILLTPNHIRPKILHIGYFGQWNCGDDAFMHVFKYLNNQSYVSHFANEGYVYQYIVLGGGDVINSYFWSKIEMISTQFKMKLIAFGVGIPYTNQLHLLDKFDKIILRNKSDVMNVNKTHVSYLPDITWMLTKMYVPKKLFGDLYMKIGIALPRTYYHDQYVLLYNTLIIELSKVIVQLSEVCKIYLIPLGINKEKSCENDMVMINELHQLCPNTVVCDIGQNDSYVFDIMDHINSMDFIIAGRFHAHIFSAICKVPFVSLSCSRKCSELMYEWNLGEYLYKFETNEIGIPINFDANEYVEWINKIRIDDLHNKVINVYNDNIKQVSDIQKVWSEIIYS